MRLQRVFSVVIFLFFSAGASAQEKVNYKIACIGFYNLENLFDTDDDPITDDAEYLPDGANHWDSLKYANKLHNMSTVIADIGTELTPDGVAVLGVAEIENKKVLEDLIAMPLLKDRKYKIVHYNSPDRRGVDVGMIYQEKYFKVENSASYRLVFPNEPDYFTRDQLVVTGNMDGEDVSIIVAHWPSRRGGQAASEPNRIAAAELGRRIIDSLLAENPKAKIVLMGDLNDDPINVSVTEYIRAKGKISKVKTGDMYNVMYDHFKSGNGTLAWNDAWNLFDQMIVSEALISTDATSYVFHQSYVYRKDYIIQQEGNYKGYPLRTHAGGVYLNGYSDHFPVYMIFKKAVK
ncbi:MAG: endonuclease/exonuclease/phosphatase family protein [Crocinitomicaceae bacterium]|nr:endonuclease/exonuclease/phosphatase family protein [Crocinitomicaceae bacterium]